jgi:hypothetical protein
MINNDKGILSQSETGSSMGGSQLRNTSTPAGPVSQALSNALSLQLYTDDRTMTQSNNALASVSLAQKTSICKYSTHMTPNATQSHPPRQKREFVSGREEKRSMQRSASDRQ